MSARLRIRMDYPGPQRRDVVFDWDGRELVRCDASELHLPDQMASAEPLDDNDFVLPERLRHELAPVLRGAPDELLLVDLAEPAGLLPIIPWERLLGWTGRWVVRDSGAFRPWTALRRTRVVMVVSDVVGRRGPGIVLDAARAWSRFPGTEVEVFCNKDLYVTLRKYPGQDELFRLHPPYRPGLEPTVESADPWLDWVVEQCRAHRDGVVDVVHLVSTGVVSGNAGGVPLLTMPPGFPALRRIVGPVGIDALLSVLGAWGLMLSAPNQRGGLPALRQLADTVVRTGTAAACVAVNHLDGARAELLQEPLLQVRQDWGAPEMAAGSWWLPPPIGDQADVVPAEAAELIQQDHAPRWVVVAVRLLEAWQAETAQLTPPARSVASDAVADAADLLHRYLRYRRPDGTGERAGSPLGVLR